MQEKELYESVVLALQKKFASIGKCYFAVTSGKFPPKIEKELDDYALLIFKEEKYSPDITGFVTIEDKFGWTSKKIIVAEVKKKIRLTNIYQAKRYAELLDAEYALLIAPQPISERKRRFLIRRKPSITSYFPNRQIIIAQLAWETVTPGRPQEQVLKVDKEMYLSLPKPFKDDVSN
jgi:hypothetical protein